MEKFVVIFPIPEPYHAQLILLMDRVAAITGLPPPHHNLPPHVTFHRPLEGLDKDDVYSRVRSAILKIRQTRITVHSLYPFGKHYIVLPVHATLTTSILWVSIAELLGILPEYRHEKYDGDNTLHISVATKTTDVFDHAWPRIARIPMESMTIPLTALSIYRKGLGGGWAPWQSFAIRP